MKPEDSDAWENADEPKLPELKLDAKQAQGFITFFRKLPENEQVMRFFDRKDYYSAHGKDATSIVSQFYKTMTALRQLSSGRETLSSVSISKSMFETILRDILLERTSHTVELYEGSGSNWRLVKIATPGRLGTFEDVLFSSNDMQDTPVLMSILPAIQDNQHLLGVAFVDMNKRILGVTEFLDDDQFTNLESALVAQGCRECLVSQDILKSLDGRRIKDVFARCNVLITEKKKSDYQTHNLDQDLSRLLKGSMEQHREVLAGSKASNASLAALISYMELLADDSNYSKFTLQRYNLSTHMRLDAAALRALNVLESKMDANKNFSLFGLMNRTCTAAMGKRLLRRWLKQPLVDAEEITHRLDIVQAFVEGTELRQDLRQHLKRIPDVERLIRKIEKKKASLQDVVKLYQASVRVPFIKEALYRYEGQFSESLRKAYGDRLKEWSGPNHLGKYEGLVEAAVDLDELQNGDYVIAAGYDSSLQNLKAERDSVDCEIRRVHQEAANDLSLNADKSLKLDKTSQWGHVFRITKKEEPTVRRKLCTQYVTLETRKDGIKFTNAKLRRLSEQYMKLTEEYNNTQRELVNKVVEVAATFVEVFDGLANRLAEMDVLLSFADLAVSSPTTYVRPMISLGTEGDIVLEGCRHPCVEAQEDVNFIPNDCRLVRDKSWFQIITGPNMGGKSTFIRQVGVNVLMAQVGCFVPCQHAQISVRDSIFARVGAGDCQLRGVSTFMSEMLETAVILKAATPMSLIIIDELGRGTSTYDGFGLAWAICEHLVKVTKAPTLFATHFHELTALAGEASLHLPYQEPLLGVANFHVSAHIDTESRKVTMLYKVEDGPCDQSFGIHVAEFAHFPPSVVELAKEKAAELESFSSSSLQVGDGMQEELGAKRKRVIGPDATRASKFLKDFAALPLDKMGIEDALNEVSKLTNELQKDAQHYPWLQQFF